jgi:hypothetical protein
MARTASFIIHRMADVSDNDENNHFGVLNQDGSVKGAPPENSLYCQLRADQLPLPTETADQPSPHGCPKPSIPDSP